MNFLESDVKVLIKKQKQNTKPRPVHLIGPPWELVYEVNPVLNSEIRLKIVYKWNLLVFFFPLERQVKTNSIN